jgi:hypothetical protein
MPARQKTDVFFAWVFFRLIAVDSLLRLTLHHGSVRPSSALTEKDRPERIRLLLAGTLKRSKRFILACAQRYALLAIVHRTVVLASTDIG